MHDIETRRGKNNITRLADMNLDDGEGKIAAELAAHLGNESLAEILAKKQKK